MGCPDESVRPELCVAFESEVGPLMQSHVDAIKGKDMLQKSDDHWAGKPNRCLLREHVKGKAYSVVNLS